MWGGVKHRRHYGDLFRNWSATKGLESLRASLYTEPRPWYLAFALHQHRHLLQDYQCARLLAWCTTVLQLRTDLTSKKEAYRYAHETLHMLAHSHKVGPDTLQQCFRLCAAGKDLTSAFNWYQYWIEAQNDGADTLWPLVWLLRIAHECPSDDSVEDMAVAVRDAYLARLGVTDVVLSREGPAPYVPFVPESRDEDLQWRAFGTAFWVLRPRLRDEKLRQFVEQLPISCEAEPDMLAGMWLRNGLPQPSHHHLFPHLEQRVSRAAERPTIRQPFLQDSLLHPDFLAKLEEASFAAHDAKAVVALLQLYKEEVQVEKQRRERSVERRSDTELWRQYADPCAQRFRHALIEEGGLTPELYHYLIVALAIAHPSAALRTIDRMSTASLRVLDITRAVVLIAARGASDEQLRLFKDQLAEIDARRRLDADYQIDKAVEHYWKFEYTDFFHYQNRLEEEPFYRFLLDGLTPADVQRLILDSGVCGPTATTEDLVVLNEPLRYALRTYFRQQVGRAAVDEAMNAITQHVPKLDITLINSVPHFANYTLAEAENIATDLAAFRAHVQGFDTIYVLDTSFVESGESFLSLGSDGSESKTPSSSLVLVPYVVLQQLADSVAQSAVFVTFDPNLQEGLREEPLLASQRLRALAAMTMRPTAGGAEATPSHHTGTAERRRPGRQVRLVHFSESLLAHAMAPATLAESQEAVPRVAAAGGDPRAPPCWDGSPATSDNDHLLLVVAMVRALCDATTQVVLCADDPTLPQRLQEAAALETLFAGPVQILSTQAPEQIVETNQMGGLVNDNPVLEVDAEVFEPKLGVSTAALGHSPPPVETANSEHLSGSKPSEMPPADESRDLLDSPWLRLLDDTDDGSTSQPDSTSTPVSTSVSSVTTSVTSDAEAEKAQREIEVLMNLYETPHDVVPVGAKMAEASRLDSVFGEFDSVDPYEKALAAEERAARRSHLETQTGGTRTRPRRRSALEKEFLQNRGASNKERYQLARSLSNQSGGRVPFNFRYKVVEADISNPKNAALRRAYEQGVERKRDHFKRNSQR